MRSEQFAQRSERSSAPDRDLVEQAMALLRERCPEERQVAHALRVRDGVRQVTASAALEAAALVHDLERLERSNSYELCEKLGPEVLGTLSAFITVIWVEKTGTYDRPLSRFDFQLEGFSFQAAALRDGILLRALDWIDNKRTFLSGHEQLPLLHKHIGGNFYVPLLEHLGYPAVAEQIRQLIR